MKLYGLAIPTLFFLVSCSEPSSSAQQPEETLKDTVVLAVDTFVEPAIPDTFSYNYVDGAVDLTWDILAMVDFEDTFNEELQDFIPYPTFHAPVQILEGQEVIVQGFVIPLEETGEEIFVVLSANPYISCFFCGGAGPETVMDIKLKPDIQRRFSTDEKIAFRGRLRLNSDDLYYLNYILEEAEPVVVN